ncbi:uncharacterized protein BCR38DRAFT_472784 [Pseudomassariella vexata]|uniref:Uncharacterized protein n=1 Tax=Pseudomassariella vexata TaxID=1141098 RepID=A0A1Y2E737_9PEZI|nr:uncharacterized protein BCR38DRAFT_472784 [Pseudomassariella vexata]ORY67360.1 hypothetical protein BCR38DRAFT_472784 [Pseudomassariella vexata]
MELTPIRITGKRRRKGEPAMPIVHPKDGIKASKRRKTKEKAVFKPKASYLEKSIPLEIMERIFWMSENVNLPRASLRLGWLLSAISTRQQTFLEAFGPTWDVWFGCLRRVTPDSTVQSYYGWDSDSIRFGGNPEFQSALLQYSWVNISFIMECCDLWAHRYGMDRPLQQISVWSDPAEDSSGLNLLHPGGHEGLDTAQQRFRQDYDEFCIRSSLPLLIEDVSFIEVHRGTQIPDKLLTGPWDEDALQKFFWMLRAGARLSPEQTWETTLEGFQNAMATETDPPSGFFNMRVIRLLYLLGSFLAWPDYILAAETEKLFERMRTIHDERRPELTKIYRVVERMLRYHTRSWRISDVHSSSLA